MIDFDKLKIIRRLGAGVYGTTYLVNYREKQYAMKIQHILESDVKKSFSSSLWREMDLYTYIDKMKPSDQQFFVKLLGYEIIDECKHKQKREFKVNFDDKNDKWAQSIKKLDGSNWCIKYLLEYKGNVTLTKYLKSHTPTTKLMYSFIIQLMKIIMLLYEGGYSHADLHGGNIMINKTSKKYFDFYGKQINYHGYQLCAIDYGEVMHKKFKIKYEYPRNMFLKNMEEYTFIEMQMCIIYIINNFNERIDDCIKNKKKLPWDKNINMHNVGIYNIIEKHNDFFKNTIKKYIDLFPKSKNLVNGFAQKLKSVKAIDKLGDNKKSYYFLWYVLSPTLTEFEVTYPKLYSKYFGWCSTRDFLIPQNDVIELLSCVSIKELVTFALSKM